MEQSSGSVLCLLGVEGISVSNAFAWRRWIKPRPHGINAGPGKQLAQLVNGRRVGAGTPAASATDGPLVIADLDDLEPTQCALLVLGCQPCVLARTPAADALIMKTNAAIDIVRRYGSYVGFTRVAIGDAGYRFIPSTNKEFSALAQDRRFQDGTREVELHPALAVQPGDMIVQATRLSAFSTTDLDEQLTNLGVTTLIIAGVDTTGVVLSTVREAADRDYRLIVLSDCTADPDVEAHDLLMSRIFPRQAEITTVGKLYRWLAGDLVRQGAEVPAPRSTAR